VEHFGIKRDHSGPCRFDADGSFRSNRDVKESTHVYIDFHAGRHFARAFCRKGRAKSRICPYGIQAGHIHIRDEELHIVGMSPKNRSVHGSNFTVGGVMAKRLGIAPPGHGQCHAD
jgi:hypothetical protein